MKLAVHQRTFIIPAHEKHEQVKIEFKGSKDLTFYVDDLKIGGKKAEVNQGDNLVKIRVLQMRICLFGKKARAGQRLRQRHPVKLYQTALPRMVQLETGQAARSVLRRI